MALHPSEYGITRAISSLKTQQANQWHCLPFGLFYLCCKYSCLTSPASLIKTKENHSKRAHFKNLLFFFSFLFLFTYILRKPSSSLNSQMGFMNVLKFSAACFDILAWYVVHAFSRHWKFLENEVEFSV